MDNYQTLNILMVDDDTVDVKVFERALKKDRISNPFFKACDGEAAMELLNSGEIQPPLIIFLDINMPRMNGFEFLSALRQNETFKDAKVFMMTTSSADSDRRAAEGHDVTGYMVKSEMGQNFKKATDLLDDFWKVIQIPV